MINHQPTSVLAFHSCDIEIGLKVLLGLKELKPSDNPWDWLADGIYSWEQNPIRAFDYASDSQKGTQFNKVRIKTPFVLGAIIDLGNCLNLAESQSIRLLTSAYESLVKISNDAGNSLPINKGANKALDCAVIRHLHYIMKNSKMKSYDTIRAAFHEGEQAFPGSSISEKMHIQIAVRNTECIKGYFLPKPYSTFNPELERYLNADIIDKLLMNIKSV